MQIALVIGSTISTIKDEAIRGRKLLIVRKADTGGNMTGEPFVAVDTVSAGTGDLVLITEAPPPGSPPRPITRRSTRSSLA